MSESRAIPFGRPWITEEDKKAVLGVLDGPILTHGPQTRSFEEEFGDLVGGGARCVAVSSCMAALHLAYLAVGVGPGDEVIVPAQTHTATAHAVEWTGARPIFVDCDRATGNLTADGIAPHLGPRTKAIAVVHFVGIPCAMRDIVTLAERRGLRVVEDCALAVGARYRSTHVGLFGDAGCFSFYPVKHLTTGEGGMLVTRKPEVAEAVTRLRAFGVDRSHTERAIPGMYDVPTLGLNYRMSELHAALGRTQLRRIEESLRRRGENFQRLRQGLAGIAGLRVIDATGAEASNSHYCLSVVLEDGLRKRRDDVVKGLIAAGVGTSVYYPHPVPRLGYYRGKYGYEAATFPHAAEISDCSVALPVGPHLGPGDVEYVVVQLRRVVQEITS